MRKTLFTTMSLFLLSSFLMGKGNFEEKLKSKFLVKQTLTPSEVRTIRHIEAGSVSRTKIAQAEVETSQTGNKFTYRFISESGSRLVKGKIRDLLRMEAEAVTSGTFSRSSFVEQNYTFFEPEEYNQLWKFPISPKRKDELLISGFVTVDGHGSLYSSDGKLVKSPSWWVTDVIVKAEYKEISGIDLPVKMEARAKLRLKLGESFLTMDYRYLSVNGNPTTETK